MYIFTNLQVENPKMFLIFQNLLFEENNEVNDKMQFVFSFFAPSYETRILSKYNNLNG